MKKLKVLDFEDGKGNPVFPNINTFHWDDLLGQSAAQHRFV